MMTMMILQNYLKGCYITDISVTSVTCVAALQDSSDHDDDEDIQFNTVIYRPAQTTPTLSPYSTQMDPGDRPITPMKNTMVYDPMNSSLDFKDGKQKILIYCNINGWERCMC